MHTSKVLCENRHEYSSRFSFCPHCPNEGVHEDLARASRSSDANGADGNEGQAEPPNGPRDPKNLGYGTPTMAGPATTSNTPTQGIFPAEQGFEPVVGWLVCFDGPSRGRDFRLHAQNNWIGRAETMDVVVKGDPRIQKERHASISYDPVTNGFTLLPSEGSQIAYIRRNPDEEMVPVYQPQPLRHLNHIILGECAFVFVPLCGEEFQWMRAEEN